VVTLVSSACANFHQTRTTTRGLG